MRFYCEEAEAVLRDVDSTSEGLTGAEAEKRLAANGKNKLAEGKKDSLIKRFFQQMGDPMIIILLVAAAISGVLAVVEGESFADVIIILAVVIINAVLGVYQESKAEKAIEALQQMSAATSKVLRDGKMVTVHSEDLVVGDVVILEAGDAVPADGRILTSASMKIEEAALTGESVPVSKFIDIINLAPEAKDVPLGDRKNMVYMGSTVVYGRGTAVITATGMDTEMGKIADALSTAEQGQTPLQIKLSQLSKVLTWLVLGICVVIFAVQLLRAGGFSFDVVLNSFMVAVSLAVAAIPEGLAAVVTVVLSIGVTNMSRRNAIIRRLTAVETLGCAQIICSDKTGTLTQNRMTVTDTWTDDPILLAKAMALCSDAKRSLGMHSAEGEPTEAALVNHAHDLRLYKDELDEKFPRIGEAPFDSGRKMMSTVHNEDGKTVQYTKGATEMLLERCSGYWYEGGIHPITEEYKENVRRHAKEFADRALRVLGAAFRPWDGAPADYEAETLEHDLVFIGFLGMIDPCRPEVYGAIRECREAGIRPIMITGDHIDTAVAIAKELGILKDASEAVTKAVRFVINLAPFGILGLVFSAVSTSGLAIFTEYGKLLLILVGCMLFAALVVNPIMTFIVIRKNPYPLVFKCLKESGVTAFFTRSSAANIPVNMSLCESLGLDKEFYSVSIPLGATINMAGAAVTITVMTLAAVHTLGITVQLPVAIILSVMAALGACGASGVAGGSLLLIPMACSLFGISNDIAMQVVGVGFIIGVIQDSVETAINSSSDALFTAVAEFKQWRKAGKEIQF